MKMHKKLTRRDFMASAGGTIVSIGLPGVFYKLLDSENRAVAAQLQTGWEAADSAGPACRKSTP